MVSDRTINRIFSPILSGLKHIFFRPITVKYPFEKSYNVPDSNYRFDPKEGVAYPGYKGRHVLYLDKCTGCAACDRACEYVSEAITMVYGYDILLKLSKNTYSKLQQAGEVARAVKLFLEPFSGELKSVEKGEDQYILRLNSEPVFEYRCEALYENLLENSIYRLSKNGWKIDLIEHKPVESMKLKIGKDDDQLGLDIEKRDFGFKQNKRSIFPAVDYSRCVFCGLCVDACPFYALEMGPSYELSSTEREELFYTPSMLARKFFETHPPETTWSEKTIMLIKRYK